ncbi:hypothetical protein [Legionella brunensis]|uniref:Uncharacterized protein n=1 Tax=Legionella brunensis TaxID=29422 RepID=A0A0W0STA9_9GAMM|nr:hypothetical protein [Legionella brunensis]KTC86600.1 hypothetical protein Lbru_0541 [Legionella brunensis]
MRQQLPFTPCFEHLQKINQTFNEHNELLAEIKVVSFEILNHIHKPKQVNVYSIDGKNVFEWRGSSGAIHLFLLEDTDPLREIRDERLYNYYVYHIAAQKLASLNLKLTHETLQKTVRGILNEVKAREKSASFSLLAEVLSTTQALLLAEPTQRKQSVEEYRKFIDQIAAQGDEELKQLCSLMFKLSAIFLIIGLIAIIPPVGLLNSLAAPSFFLSAVDGALGFFTAIGNRKVKQLSVPMNTLADDLCSDICDDYSFVR